MFEVVEVRLRESGKILYFSTNGMKFNLGDYVIVEADRGLDYAQVISESEVLLDSDVEEPLCRVLRKTNPWDLRQIEKNRKKAKEMMKSCSKKIQEHKLPMKLIDAEFSFDRSKIIFYFTAEDRVDFRNLVKDLANIFKIRIELKQIGVRDEARLLGGIGPCGRALCCASFLKDFEPVTIRMAKEQALPLNPTKISGLCGRLMCCLGYEYKSYKELTRRMPRQGDKIRTDKGVGRVVGVNPLKKCYMLEFEDGTRLEKKIK